MLYRGFLLPGMAAVAMLFAVLAAVDRGTAPAAAQATESVELFPGCNNVSLTWPNGTSTDVVAAAISPIANVIAIWRFNNVAQTFQGYSPQFPQASDLRTVNVIDAVFICMSDRGVLVRPVLAPGSTVAPPPVVAATATAAAQQRSGSALPPGASLVQQAAARITPTPSAPVISFASTAVARGGVGQVSVRTGASAQCTGTFTLPGGQAISMGTVTAGAGGIAQFVVEVPQTATAGAATVSVTCGGQTTTTQVPVT